MNDPVPCSANEGPCDGLNFEIDQPYPQIYLTIYGTTQKANVIIWHYCASNLPIDDTSARYVIHYINETSGRHIYTHAND